MLQLLKWGSMYFSFIFAYLHQTTATRLMLPPFRSLRLYRIFSVPPSWAHVSWAQTTLLRNEKWHIEDRNSRRHLGERWPPPLALLAPSLHFRESKWTAKGREQPKIASLEFSSMPLLLPVIASLSSNMSPSSSFKLVKECVLQGWCQSHLTHESSLGNRVMLNVSNIGVGCENCTSIIWKSWWR